MRDFARATGQLAKIDALDTRMLALFLALASSIRLGNPLDPEMGPLTSTTHRDRVLSYCKVAREEGGEVLIGGRAPAEAVFARGCYVMPTVVRAQPHDRVCQKEVFGPFVTVTTFKDEEEAFGSVRGSGYGRDMGFEAMRDYTTAKSVWVNVEARIPPYYRR